MKESLVIILLCAVVVSVFASPDKCHLKKTYKGCKLSYGKCVCSRVKECRNPFPYASHRECEKDLKGLNDRCRREQCRNGGICVQVKHANTTKRSWMCECAGTGYYGKRCQHECPPQNDPMPKNYPAACVLREQ